MTVGLLSVTGSTNWSLLDGSPNAGTGTPQFSSLLSGYTVRPPWKVAGVDFSVGLKTNVSVNTGTDVITITGSQNNHINGQQVSFHVENGGTLPGGVALDTAYFVVNVSTNTFKVSLTSGGAAIDLTGSPNKVVVLKITVAGANSMPPGVVYASGQSHTGLSLESVNPNGASDTTNGNQSATGTITIDSYDFSTPGLGHGISIATGGFNGTVNVQNCYFKVGDWLQTWIWQDLSATDIYNLTNNEFDGGGLIQFGNSLRNLQHGLYRVPGGTWTYNWFHHMLAPILASPVSLYTMKFNVTNNSNYGPQASHNDGMFPDVASDISGSDQSWNLVYQPTATVFTGGNGYPGEMDTSFVIFLQPNNSLTLNNITSTHNTVIGLGSTGHMNTTSQTGGPAFAIGWDIEPKVSNTISNMQITNNYVDSTGMEQSASFGIIKSTGGAGTVSGLVTTGNISMTTGATIVANQAGTQ